MELSNKAKENLLHLACENGQIHLIKTLLKQKVNIDAKNSEGFSPIHVAAIKGNFEVTKLLLNDGANIEMKDDKRKSTPFLYACQNGRTKIAKLLIEKGANTKAESSLGIGAMHFAAQSGNFDVVKILQDKGFDINCTTKSQETPLHYVLDHHRHPFGKVTSTYDIVKALIQSGANVEQTGSYYDTPLKHAVMRHDKQIIKLLISHGANLNHGFHFNSTPIHFAASWDRSEEIVKTLVEHGAIIDGPRYILRFTALHCNVIRNGSIETARGLLENGARLEHKNVDGFTAFDYAIKHENAEFDRLALVFQPTLVSSLKKGIYSCYTLKGKDLNASKMIFYHCHK